MPVIVGMGTIFRKDTTVIAQLTSIDGISVTSDSIESTALDTPGGYRTFVNGLKDGGEVTLGGYFDTSHILFLTDFEAGTTNNYSIEFPNKGGGATPTGSKWSFSGVVTSFSTGSVEMEDLISMEVTIKVSGKPTLSPPSV